MFAEFGSAPLCLELDFDSYDGSWQHVSRFRNGSGWLIVAECTIESEHDMMTARLVAACDEHENPIPAFQAKHLTECDWLNPVYCDELPPDVLDDLICEEEGAAIVRWHREKNGALAEAFENQETRIAELEGRVRSLMSINDARIADLRQRRRHPMATPEMRLMLAEIIRDIDEENDELVNEMAETRAIIRAQAESIEESLWSREDLLVDVVPLHVVRWSPAVSLRSDIPSQRKPYSTTFTPACGRTGGSTVGFDAINKVSEAKRSCALFNGNEGKVRARGTAIANPVLLRDLQGRAQRVRRQLKAKGALATRVSHLQSKLQHIEQRIARLKPDQT